MESGGIIDTVGQEIVGVMAPVSICMLLVVLIVYSLYNPTSAESAGTTIRTAANLVYLESSSDSTAQKLEGAILNAVVFVVIITLVTFLLVLLYYYRFNNFLLYYTRFSIFIIFTTMGSPILLSIIQRFTIPIDAVTFCLLLFNFTTLGIISVFSTGIPIVVKQGSMVALGIIVAVWLSRLPEWTTWVVLVALALYDLAAVLAPGGPLKLLVELASSRNDELPALIYESRPNVGKNSGIGHSSLGLLVAAAIGMSSNTNDSNGGVELQELLRNGDRDNVIRVQENDHLVISVGESRTNRGEIEEVRDDAGEASPLMGDRDMMEMQSNPNDSSSYNSNGDGNRVSQGNEREGMEMKEEVIPRGIKLGMGDFIFYSVLVGRAAMYDLMTVYACYLAIISGLGCTLILLAVCRHALPALPISIGLGVTFYFLTRFLMEPFVVGASTNLLMF
ncbi:hypothetical protein OROMI_028515 [Orobanche minor]